MPEPVGWRPFRLGGGNEACKQFGEILAPLWEEVGVDERPELCQAHTFVSA